MNKMKQDIIIKEKDSKKNSFKQLDVSLSKLKFTKVNKLNSYN